jgi:1-acyl-sn-glycerol-3-phosphate acyltransferase
MKTFLVIFSKIFLKPIVEHFLEKVEGLENIPKDKNFILAPNHESYFDHFFVPYLVKDRLKKIHFIGKLESKWDALRWGWWYWLAETIPINRKAKDKRKVLEKALDFLKKGEIIIIYPEGTRNKSNTLLLGKTGVAELAIKSGLPVIPVGLKYRPSWQEKERFLFNKKITLKAGQPLYFSSKNDSENPFYLREVTNKIMREISKLTGKEYPYY